MRVIFSGMGKTGVSEKGSNYFSGIAFLD